MNKKLMKLVAASKNSSGLGLSGSFVPSRKKLRQREICIKEYLHSAIKSGLSDGDNSDAVIMALKNALPSSGQTVYLYGYKDFKNTGDQALWLSLVGLLNLLSERIDEVELVTKSDEIPDGKYGLKNNHIIVLTGGGSLGDRYNSSRRRVDFLESCGFPPAIQMPISTSFSNNAKLLGRLRNAYSEDRGVILFCRDEVSLSEAREIMGLKGILSKDMAEYLPVCSKFSSGECGHLFLLRTDSERSGEIASPIEGSVVVDWDDIEQHCNSRVRIVQYFDRILFSDRVKYPSVLNRLICRARLRRSLNISLSRTSRALAFLSFYNSVTTDRLHGAILAHKLGLAVSYYDNDHGKLSRYFETWGGKYSEIKKLE